MPMRPRRLVLPILAAAAIGGAAWAQAQAQDDDPDGPVLHEYVAPPGASDAPADKPTDRPKTIGAEPRAGKNPAAVKSNDQLLPEPPAEDTKKPGEPVLGTNDFGADRDTSMRPDRATGADSTLHYSEPFNPSVLPFKRMSALDAVRDDYTLYVWDTRLAAQPVGGRTQAGRDTFWGSMAIALEPGRAVPIPSTAPDMRILSYEIDPPLTSIDFLKDGADNFYVKSDDPNARGTFRLRFLSDARQSYFAPTIPKGYKIADASASGLVRPVPDGARAAADEVMQTIGVDRTMALDVALDRLVEYFRKFEAGDPPPATDDIYKDLALSKKGVCRHRSFAFVITANALGIPARFVSNEAHAFAEVWIPQTGWVRVDLGGAAFDMDVTNAQDKQMYRPRGQDPFPKPPEYADNYTQLHGDIKGLTQQQLDQAHRGPSGNGPGNGSSTDPHSTNPLAPSPGQGLPAPPPSAYEGKTATKIGVSDVDATGFRGEAVRVRGTITGADGKPVGGVAVNVYLAPAGSSGDGARLVGQTVTAPDGSFQAQVDLPGDLELGRHEVYVSTPGDAKHQPALSE
jgi:hypothetical protein